MARKWLGVSGKKYQQMPHAETPPASLWWYACEPDPTWADDVPLPESQCVIETYLLQCKRGRALPTGFGKKLAQWLQDLSREPKISPHRKRYWTIPAYALAQKLPEKTLCKRLREMEKIAKRLFPQRVPSNRQIGRKNTSHTGALYRGGGHSCSCSSLWDFTFSHRPDLPCGKGTDRRGRRYSYYRNQNILSRAGSRISF